ncbi:MAG TPA: hypothetical protein EYN66_15225 [Myxococcales bacterium]|nr:hypothetical protein [Myxococcales bacterium]
MSRSLGAETPNLSAWVFQSALLVIVVNEEQMCTAILWALIGANREISPCWEDSIWWALVTELESGKERHHSNAGGGSCGQSDWG